MPGSNNTLIIASKQKLHINFAKTEFSFRLCYLKLFQNHIVGDVTIVPTSAVRTVLCWYYCWSTDMCGT